MFRKKDNEPPRPGGASEPAFSRPASEAKPAVPAEPARRPLDVQPTSAAPEPAPKPAELKRLIVGQGISLSGEITACDRLIVEGKVQVTLNETKAIEISESGEFTNGKAEVDEAEISGIYEGELTVRGRLLIRSSGRVKGTVRFGEIEVERGGQLSGSVSMLVPGFN